MAEATTLPSAAFEGTIEEMNESDDEATQLMLEALFDIKAAVFDIHPATCSERTMERKRPRKTPEEWAEIKARHEDIMRRLQEMIDRYRAMNEEKRRRREAGAS